MKYDKSKIGNMSWLKKKILAVMPFIKSNTMGNIMTWKKTFVSYTNAHQNWKKLTIQSKIYYIYWPPQVRARTLF